MDQLCYGAEYWKQWLTEQDPGWKCDMGFSAGDLLGMLKKPAEGNEFLMLVQQFVVASLMKAWDAKCRRQSRKHMTMLLLTLQVLKKMARAPAQIAQQF